MIIKAPYTARVDKKQENNSETFETLISFETVGSNVRPEGSLF